MIEFNMLKEINWKKMNDLVPVIVQDIVSKDVLMQAYVSREAFALTVKTGYAHYYSRHRNKIWKKGETSGNIQNVTSIYVDCDGDCLLYFVEQQGVACHTGHRSCFFYKIFGSNNVSISFTRKFGCCLFVFF